MQCKELHKALGEDTKYPRNVILYVSIVIFFLVYTFPSPFCRSHSNCSVNSKENSLIPSSLPRAFEIILVSQDRNISRGFPKVHRFPTQIRKQQQGNEEKRKPNHKMIPASGKV